MKAKATIVSVDDDYLGVYVDGELVYQGDNSSQYWLVHLLENNGVIVPGTVEFVSASRQSDERISEAGGFPGNLSEIETY